MGRIVRNLVVGGLLAILVGVGCRGALPLQEAGTVRDVAGNLSQQIEQQMGLTPEMLGKLALCIPGWIMALGLFGWLMPNPRKAYSIALVVGLVCFFAAGLPLLLFYGR